VIGESRCNGRGRTERLVDAAEVVVHVHKRAGAKGGPSYFFQRAAAALRADSLRCAAVIFSARAFPPLSPPFRPSATAAGSFPASGSNGGASPDTSPTGCFASSFGSVGRLRERSGIAMSVAPHLLRGEFLTNDQTESRRAVAAACSRSLTSASSFAARSMRSCCICARFCWVSTRSCWLSARVCWRSARSVIALRPSAIVSTVRVSSANCSATLAMSSWVVTFCRSLRGEAMRRADARGRTSAPVTQTDPLPESRG
jgi:hypothetical protein